MKRTLILGLLLTSVAAFAYGPHGGEMRFAFDELNLTAKQKEQLKTIRREARTERIKLTDKLDDLRDQTEERMMAVLTDEQKKSLLAARKSMREKREPMRCNHDKMPKNTPR